MRHLIQVSSNRTAGRPVRRWGRRISSGVVCIALVALLLPVVSAAEEYTAARKLGRGAAGLAGGILELPGHILEESRAHGAGRALTIGFAEGLGAFITRTLVGALEFVTFPFPFPANYEPLLEPEYPWERISK